MSSGGASSKSSHVRSNNSSEDVRVHDHEAWASVVLEELKFMVPGREKDKKQKCGKICVVGGSLIHSGAPFYSGHSAMCCGVDEVTILTTASAAIPIKCYNPCLNVLAELPEENGTVDVLDFVDRVWPIIKINDAFCIGPGLGHDTITMGAVSKLISTIREAKKPLVIDDDALWILTKTPELLAWDIPAAPVILTPNKTEFNFLWGSLVGSWPVKKEGKDGVSWDDAEYLKKDQVGLVPVFEVDCPQGVPFNVSECPDVMAVQQTALLARTIGPNVTILRKGYVDLIASSSKCFVLSRAQVPRRCGGQGAVLAGLSTSFLAWMKLANENSLENPLLAVYGAAILTRFAVQVAFENKSRCMQAPDIMDVLAQVIEDCLGQSESEDLSVEIHF